MFSPNFGMFIAPGCNGIRGGLTMGYLALVLGHLFNLKVWVRAALTTYALVLGYLFNLIRLCLLVLYYWLGIRIEILQPHAGLADYLIGGVLFGLAALFFFQIIKRSTKRRDVPTTRVSTHSFELSSQEFWRRLLVSSVVLLIAASPYAYAKLFSSTVIGTADSALFPQNVGPYRLARTWRELDNTNHLLYVWSQYVNPIHKGSEIEVGLWFPSRVHYPLWCHLAFGEKPQWSAVETIKSRDGKASTFQFSSYQYEDTDLVEASTICSVDGCYENGIIPSHRGLSYRTAGLKNFLLQSFSPSRALLLRKKVAGLPSLPQDLKPQAVDELETFITTLNSSDFKTLRRLR